MTTYIITKCLILTILSIAMRPGILILAQQPDSCYFVFGDDMFDNGNNNKLITRAKANYLPYGIDYVNGSTGRFTNDANISDIIAKRLRFRSVPPYVKSGRSESNAIDRGLNYASGAAGILNETSYQLGDLAPMNEQLRNHFRTINRLTVLLGSRKLANKLLNECLYTISIGGNDYLTNYFFQPPVNSNRVLFTPEKFAEKLIQQYSQQLELLYKLEARKIAVFGIIPIGCIPNSLSQNPSNGSQCVDYMNKAVQIFNSKLISLVNYFNSNFAGARFTYINLYDILSANLSTIGVRVSNTPCCEVSQSTLGLCVANGKVCSDRNEYAYFDNYHPTGVVYNYAALRAINAQSPSDATPFDIATLVSLKNN